LYLLHVGLDILGSCGFVSKGPYSFLPSTLVENYHLIVSVQTYLCPGKLKISHRFDEFTHYRGTTLGKNRVIASWSLYKRGCCSLRDKRMSLCCHVNNEQHIVEKHVSSGAGIHSCWFSVLFTTVPQPQHISIICRVRYE
jgi:hypothetical protein